MHHVIFNEGKQPLFRGGNNNTQMTDMVLAPTFFAPGTAAMLTCTRARTQKKMRPLNEVWWVILSDDIPCSVHCAFNNHKLILPLCVHCLILSSSTYSHDNTLDFLNVQHESTWTIEPRMRFGIQETQGMLPLISVLVHQRCTRYSVVHSVSFLGFL